MSGSSLGKPGRSLSGWVLTAASATCPPSVTIAPHRADGLAAAAQEAQRVAAVRVVGALPVVPVVLSAVRPGGPTGHLAELRVELPVEIAAQGDRGDRGDHRADDGDEGDRGENQPGPQQAGAAPHAKRVGRVGRDCWGGAAAAGPPGLSR
ncbi:hypothetical protein GCM10020000_38890 [Streptomyces olivoverticillatus]